MAVSVAPTVTAGSLSGADDPAIWIHPSDTAKSTIIGSDKSSSSGLRVFNLSGTQIQSVSSGKINNVDVRYNFPLGGTQVSIVAGSNLSDNSISIYRVDPASGLLQNAAARTITAGVSVYGFALYHSEATNKFYAFVNGKNGVVEQWELFDNGANKIDAKRVRSFDVGSQVEGMVADDVLGRLYVGEENVGVWHYSAEPNGGTSRGQVDSTSGRLSADVEGLAIYYGPNGTGYLLVSSQGSNEFAVYRRDGSNAYVGSFQLSGTSKTDGIEVTNVGLGTSFAQGMFVAQNQDKNFKFVPWQSIATKVSPGLTIDTASWDPRRGATPPQPPTNQAPKVDAGSDRVGTPNAVIALDATVTDDGLPSGKVLPQWTVVSGPGTVTFANSQNIDTTAQFSAVGQYQLRLTASDGQLSANDVMTVTINAVPTTTQVSFQDGISPSSNYRGTRDTMLQSDSPTKSNGAATSLSTDGSPDQAILLKWDISNIPTGSVVQRAELTLQITNASDQTYPIYALIRNWDEVSSTWRQATPGVNWATAGASSATDRGQTSVGTLRGTSKSTVTVQLNAAGVALVQAWVNNPSANFGIVIQNYGNSDGLDIASHEASSGRPKLTVVYANSGTSSFAPITASAIAAALEIDETARKNKRSQLLG